MEPLVKVSSPACPLPLENVDTDQLIPARFMKESRAKGYGGFLLHDHRFDAEGKPRDFILNHEQAAGSEILVARRNFGGGSSREAAVYAMVDFGFRCVVAPSFGDIFASNAVNNGLLPAVVSEADAERLLDALAGEPRPVTVDLKSQAITFQGGEVSFDVNPTWKEKLLNGWDDIDLTLARTPDIERFREDYLDQYPWLA
ncbi:3-isopropylmalate dehydratase small subunit [Marinobacter nanhaiticus D15-8W]|uniref:3-isopropylmalate dehydratase n=1 Tax=Marinobacter nanhaiticus D15-8W TaxID=626887 RepID=N6WTD3_9GAMM|nr:3-isopropylmalate dehydratase small subunit [Marinobacter nanhaiticus]ENO14741.1 3-isopropylmalate dehydratase small subunit [Marinobacter nanhaiticus D15-8W]BES69571.1 3-isopropylmalate dehydratase small subunit [Marinobacter nanhaiticus D15-8W]